MSDTVTKFNVKVQNKIKQAKACLATLKASGVARQWSRTFSPTANGVNQLLLPVPRFNCMYAVDGSHDFTAFSPDRPDGLDLCIRACRIARLVFVSEEPRPLPLPLPIIACLLSGEGSR